MLIKCISNSGKDIPILARRLGESDATSYSPLEVGTLYDVYGIQLSFNRVDFLVCQSGSNPIWAPDSLFLVVEKRFPDGFEMCFPVSTPDFEWLHNNYEVMAMIGYSELISSIDHYVGLLDRDEVELIKFFKEKIIIDSYGKMSD